MNNSLNKIQNLEKIVIILAQLHDRIVTPLEKLLYAIRIIKMFNVIKF